MPTQTPEWQELSLLDLTREAEAAFMAIVEEIPRGRLFSINDIRPRLDAADVPNAKRAGLFLRACKAGLIEPATVSTWGRVVPDVEPSTGGTAHRAFVRRYRRVPGDLVGGERS